MLRFLVLLSFVLSALIPVQAVTTTGSLTNTTLLAFKPSATTNAAGKSALKLAVMEGETAGMATVGTELTVGRLLSAARLGRLGPWGMVAVSAAQLCYEDTDWKICHSSVEPILPIQIDTSQITAATSSVVPVYKYTGPYSGNAVSSTDITTACQSGIDSFNATANQTDYVRYLDYASGLTCVYYDLYNDSRGRSKNATTNLTILSNTTVYTCLSGSTLTNSLGAPMAVTGQYCTPDSAYSCPINYSRSDSYGNLGSISGYNYCAYQSPALSEQQRADILAPYLLNYYANQLFADKDGKTLPDMFSDADTTFDPTVTPADMPMTWEDLNKYTDWITSGKGQTTNPLAPYYISPSNYKYTQTVINNTNNTNTNTDTTTNVNPTTTASSAAMTQAQFEQSTSKADKTAADAINATDTTSLDNLTKTSGFDGANDQLTNISNGNIGDLPSLPTPNLPGYSSCQTIDLSWKDHPAVFPSQSQCLKMEEAKKAFGYILYLMTFLGLVWELLRRVE